MFDIYILQVFVGHINVTDNAFVSVISVNPIAMRAT